MSNTDNPNTTGRFGAQANNPTKPGDTDPAKQPVILDPLAPVKPLEDLEKKGPIEPGVAGPGSSAFATDPDVNLNEGNIVSGITSSLSAEQIAMLQNLNDSDLGRIPVPTDPTGQFPEGFYSVGKGSLRVAGKVTAAQKIGGRFFYDPTKLTEAEIRYCASLLKSGVMTVVAAGVDSTGKELDAAE